MLEFLDLVCLNCCRGWDPSVALTVTTAVVYPEPPFVTVMAVTTPSVIVAIALAPVPSPSMITVGVPVYLAPSDWNVD